jgi:hypothetical protein
VRRVVAAVSLLLLTGCGLPLPGGVQEPGAAPAEQTEGGGDIQVLPPGPRDDASPEQIVRDFFGAQSDPADGHASARAFLAPELRARWKDSGQVSVFGGGLEVVSADGSPELFRVTGALVGRIAADGSYGPASGSINVTVQVRKGPRGRPVIVKVPDGLLLSTADRDRSFRPRSIFFLAPPATPGTQSTHVVPDPVFVPVTADTADTLVRRLIAGPSAPLGDSVGTAFPAGTRVRSVRTDASGLVTVDLTGQVAKASSAAKEQMAAQLIWTLRGGGGLFGQLRLQSEGRPVGLGTSGSEVETLDRGDLDSYAPDGLSSRAPLYYIGGRRLRLLDATTGPAADASGQRVADAAAVSPRGGGVALVSRIRGVAELTTGPTSGPFVLRARAASLTSPTWGSGERGVWFLQNGRLMLAPLSGPVVHVPIDGVGGFGPVSVVRVSRDGARIGLVAGSGTARRLLVGRIVERGSFRVVGLRSVARGIADVSDLSWETATSIVVLGRVSGVAAPVRVAVDGSSVALVNRILVESSVPSAIAAAPGRPLFLAATVDSAARLLRESGVIYVVEKGIVGTQPFYPG